MRIPPATLLVLFAALPVAYAQTPVDTAPPPSSKFPAAWYPPPSGNATTGSAIKGKPYIADVLTTGRYLNPKTGEIKSQTTSTLQARDSDGRVREETAMERPDGKGNSVPVRNITVRDPVAHCTFTWMEPWVVLPQYDRGPVATVTCEARVAHLQDYDVFRHIADEPEGETIKGDTTYKVERLPATTVEGLAAVGTRITNTRTLPNGTKEQLATEDLYSPELEELLGMRQIYVHNSSFPALDIHLENIRREEPDAKLFYPPAGYRIEPSFPYGKR